MKIKRITSLLLTVLMVFGSLQLALLPASAAVPASEKVDGDFNYYTEVFYSAEDRLSKMEHFVTVGDMEIYADDYSGEVGIKNTVTGQILLTNPYSVGSTKAAESIKNELLSQLIVNYTDNGTAKTFTSFEEASTRGQVSISRVKNGIRVEYSMGSEDPRILAPIQIEKSRFKENILDNIPSGDDKKWITNMYALWDAQAEKKEAIRNAIYERYPITREMAIYRLPTDGSNAATDADKRRIASIIKQYAPSYSFEDLDYDHSLTGYEGESREPANFKMALEYVIDGGELVVTLPANGILYNESEYTLDTIQILPYMGAGTNPNTGYTFLPDGSGALFRFENLASGNATTVNATVYGTDYAYQTIKGSYEQPVRVPVFGIVENEDIYERVETQVETESVNEAGETVVETSVATSKEYVGNTDRGFLAIIEEGEAMCQLSTYHGGGSVHNYNTVKMTVTPRPKDSYDLSTAISVGSSSIWTVVSERRYTGNYKIRYIMLTDTDTAEEKGLTDSYEPTWQGMANAYRNYLIENGILTKITEEELGDGIPLYIETFGAIQSIEKILSIPVTVMTAMTSFDDIQTMYSDLSSEGIKNINFKLTGYANGGMYAAVPYRLKWEKAVGGKNGFKELLADAKEKDYGIYPDFDFAYIDVDEVGLFSGVSLRKHAVKSIDNRYSNLRVYSAARQNYATYYQLAMSPAYYYRFVDKLTENYTDYDPIGISAGTLGYALNSDFDKKEPYNREDSKNFTIDAFESLGNSFDSVMTEGGNAFVWKDADHILDIPLDSSRYVNTSYTIPFIGYVLHGYKNFTGSAINMAGDIRYEILKCIENGAYMYFTLSYDNTELLKEHVLLSQYYSIRYDIWQEDVVALYTELNGILKDLQTKEIVGHEFLIGERIPEEGEKVSYDDVDRLTTMDDGRIVKVTYEDGTAFILNYNYFAVTADGVDVDAYGYVKIN